MATPGTPEGRNAGVPGECGLPGVAGVGHRLRALDGLRGVAILMVLVMFALLAGLGLRGVSDQPDHAAWYLLWPAPLAGRSALAVLWLALAVAATGVALRLATFALGAPPLGIYVNTFARMDALAAALGADLGRSASTLHARWLRSFGLDGLPLALAYIAAGTAVLWVLGWLSWRLIERPLQAWRPA